MSLLKLTEYTEAGVDNTFLLSPNVIERVSDNKKYRTIYTVGGDYYKVKETLEEILNKSFACVYVRMG